MSEKKNTFSNMCCTIQAGKSEMVLEVQDSAMENGGSVQIGTPNNTPNQMWTFVSVDDTFYKLVCKHSQKVLDIIDVGTNDGAWVHQWDAIETDSQLWSVQDAGNGMYEIVSKLSGKCLDVVGMSNIDGAKVQIWQNVNGENQKWKITAVNAGEKSQKPALESGFSALEKMIFAEPEQTIEEKPEPKPAQQKTRGRRSGKILK